MRRGSIYSAALLLAGCSVGCSGDGATHRAVAPSAEPRRIVSINPCLDAILLEVADPAQIAGISRYSHDPRATSIAIAKARRFAPVDETAEAVLAARPDLVLAGPHVAVQTVGALRRLGIPLVQFAVAESVAGSQAQVAALAARTGHPERGRALNLRIDAALAAGRWEGARVPALIWQGSGLVPGEGTLADELLTRTGFSNVSRAIGLRQWDILPIEAMLAHPPAVLLAGEANMGAGNAEGNRMLTHPVLRKAASRIRITGYSSRLLHCGGPTIIDSVRRLAAIRRELGDVR